MTVKIARWGNSLGVRLPKDAAEAAGLAAGAEVDVIIEGQDLRLRRRVPIPRYRLEDLVAEMDRLGPATRPALVDWGPDVGAEVLHDDWSDIAPPDDDTGSANADRRQRRP
jgi:antitoxin MazE